MEIRQIVSVNNDGIVSFYGLGKDNKMYRWDYGKAEWISYWNTKGDM